jgi:hypothetical protein
LNRKWSKSAKYLPEQQPCMSHTGQNGKNRMIIYGNASNARKYRLSLYIL